MMTENKFTGSYYTPSVLSDFLVKHLFDNYIQENHLCILEPSCGNGQFISSLVSFFETKERIRPEMELSLVDVNKTELTKANKIASQLKNANIKIINEDYLEIVTKDHKKRYSLIIGNPPYIKKEHMKTPQIKLCNHIREITSKYSEVEYPKRKIKNIWPAFVEGAIMNLEKNGILCYILPAEILQVNYTQDLRELILQEFDRVEIFAFSELIFYGVLQDVIALVGVKGVKKEEQRGVSFYQVDSLNDLKEPKFTEKYSNTHRTTLNKWTNYILSDKELECIERLKSEYLSIKDYCTKVEAGIVTAASEYFILDQKSIKNNRLHRLKDVVKPVLPKGSIVPNTIYFTSSDLEILMRANKRVNLISFPDVDKSKLGKIANVYIEKGELSKKNGGSEYHLRYKMKKRNNWYSVPSIWKSEGLFVKRSHLFPRVFMNNSGAFATDSFYRIITKKEFDIKKLVFSFNNSLTFVLAELEGRFYGGGVLELTPNEFKYLKIPYVDNISEEDFHKLDLMFRNNITIAKILDFTDAILFKKVSQTDMNLLKDIRIRLVNRRLKVKSWINDTNILSPSIEIIKNEPKLTQGTFA